MILRRGSASRPQRRDDDYDVLENGVVVGRIFVSPTAPTPPSYESAGPARDPIQTNKNNPTMLSPANNTANATGGTVHAMFGSVSVWWDPTRGQTLGIAQRFAWRRQ